MFSLQPANQPAVKINFDKLDKEEMARMEKKRKSDVIELDLDENNYNTSPKIVKNALKRVKKMEQEL